MPLSGSYYYPSLGGVSVGTFREVTIRGLSASLAPLPGIIKIFVSGTSPDQNLYYVTDDGVLHTIGAASAGSSSLPYLLVTGDAVVSGNLAVGGTVTDLNSNLILSSSVGSVVSASGSLDFPNTDKPYHIRAVNSDLVLSSSNGITYISGSATVKQNLLLGGNITNAALITANQYACNTATGVSLRNSAGHLILSSSAGSNIHISGALTVLSSIVSAGNIQSTV